MEYGLAREVIGSRTFVPLAKQEFDGIADAKGALLLCLAIEERFDLVVENFLEFEMALLESTLRDSVTTTEHQQAHAHRSLLNRRLGNLLSSARTYIDEAKAHVHRLVPSEFDAVKAAFAREYDQRLGYRAMEALRNYVQHRGSPIAQVSYRAHFVQRSDSDCVAHTMEPRIRPSDFAQDGKFKAAVRRELQAIGEEVDLKPLEREYVEGLWAVHKEIRGWIAPLIGQWEGTMRDAQRRYEEASNQGEGTVGLVAARRQADGSLSNQVAIVTDFNEHRRFLERKNYNLDHLADRYVSSETRVSKP